MRVTKCSCDRDIPVRALWSALSWGKPLLCGNCGTSLDPDDILSRIAEVEGDRDRIALIAYRQLVAYGWTSSGAIMNALEVDDPKVIGGFLSGLQRAGLIERAMGDPMFAAAIIVDPKPMFVPGPTFPFPEPQ